MPSTFAYWDIRGIAQPARLLLNYVGEDFEDKQYTVTPAPEFSRESWLKEKNTLGLDFPNLPYYIDGDIKITQSNAILRYIGRKYNLCGQTEAERVQVDMMVDQVMDLRNGFVGLCYNPQFASKVDDYKKNLPGKLKLFEDFMGDKKFAAGNEVTFADFHFYEMLDQHRQLELTCLHDFPKLTAFCERFEALPNIAKYMKSEKFLKAPLNNKMAKF